MIKLYRHELSGHSHRVELFLNLLGVPHQTIDVDLLAGEHKQAPFLTLNPFGQVPVLVDGDVVISDSNAILVYLAERYDQEGAWYPQDTVSRAEIQRWFSVAAGPIANGPGAARLVTVFGAGLDHERAQAIAEQLLSVVDGILEQRGYLAGNTPTLADLAGYSYIAHAPEGNVSLSPYPNVRAWLARIEGLPGFIGMTKTPTGLAA